MKKNRARKKRKTKGILLTLVTAVESKAKPTLAITWAYDDITDGLASRWLETYIDITLISC